MELLFILIYTITKEAKRILKICSVGQKISQFGPKTTQEKSIGNGIKRKNIFD